MAVRRKALSATTVATLKRKAKASKRYTYSTLAKVYRRGQGAFLSAGSRRVPMAAWAMGRVNSFLRGSRKHDLDLKKKKKYPLLSSTTGHISSMGKKDVFAASLQVSVFNTD